MKGFVKLNEGHCNIVLNNKSPNIVFLRKGTPVAKFKNCNEKNEFDILRIFHRSNKPEGPDVLEDDDEIIIPPQRSSETKESLDDKIKLFNISKDLNEAQRKLVLDLLIEFQDIFVIENAFLTQSNTPPIKIMTGDAPPVNVPPYRMSPSQMTEIENQVKKMLKAGVIAPSQSAYNSPVVLVKKKNNEIRFCINYDCLNKQIL